MHKFIAKCDPIHLRNIRVHMQPLIEQGMSVKKIGQLTGMRRLAEKQLLELPLYKV